MTEIGFYHLTRLNALAALPALLARSLQAGQKAVVWCSDAARMAMIDEALWREDWLPHGVAATPHPAWQPVFITEAEDNPAGAGFLFLLDGRLPGEGFSRVFDLFDGNDEAQVAAARARWVAAKEAGHSLTYWKQGDTGWVKSG